jgi:PAS domain S-box-containing protein
MRSFKTIIIALIVAIGVLWMFDAEVNAFIYSDEAFLHSTISNNNEVAFHEILTPFIIIFGIWRVNIFRHLKNRNERKHGNTCNEWKNTFDLVSDLVSVHDADFKIVKANKALVEYSGMEYKELIGTHCYKIFHGTSKPIDNCPHQKVIDSRTVVTEEIYEPTMGKHLQVSCLPYYDGKRNSMCSLNIAKDISVHKQFEKSLKQSLTNKDMLLKEVHHRVKNNLGVIQSLLNLKSQDLKDSESRSHLKDTRNRVKSMAMIHERLSRSENLAGLNFSDFISSLVNHLFHSFKINPDKVKLKLSIPEIFIDVDIMMPCGLIVNEILSNSFKYAFPGDREGEVTIELHEGKDDEVTLTVKDNGIGISDSVNLHKTKTFGLQIVSALANQIDGKADLLNKNGTEFILTFHKSKN